MNWRWWRRPAPAVPSNALIERCVAAIAEAGSPWYGQVMIEGRWLVWSGPYALLNLELRSGHYLPVTGLPGVYYWAFAKEGVIGLALGPQSEIRATLWPAEAAQEAGI